MLIQPHDTIWQKRTDVNCTKYEQKRLRISSVNVTKSAENCGFGHIY